MSPMNNLYFYVCIVLFLCSSCEYERFETELNVSMKSRIANLDVRPTPLAINVKNVDDNLISSSYSLLDTIYTDEFGNFNKTIELGKLAKNYYYELNLPETKWVLPLESTAGIRSGIVNNIVFNIEPKWRHDVRLTDTSGRYKVDELFIYNSKTKNYYQFERSIDISPFGNLSIITSAPSYSFIFITLRLIDRITNERATKEIIINAEEVNEIWINY
ncbi:MAG: hypothetical protein ACI9AU_000868 [Bacteroidia bacterium]|jgi:hypothetical protein